VAAIFMALAPWRWGRWALAVGAVLLLLGLPFVSAPLLDQLGGAPPVEALGGTGTLGFRQDVWSQAVAALHDFPFTGTGLGAFRRIVFVLYPIQISPTYDVAHAHNFFLQTGLDFGLPGLVALIALYLVAAAVLVRSWKHLGKGGAARWWVLGLGGSLVAQIVYGQLDTVAMGAKTNLLFWYGVALMLTLCLHWPSRIVSREDHACLRGAGSSGGKG
jgi:O-antigen ligase